MNVGYNYLAPRLSLGFNLYGLKNMPNIHYVILISQICVENGVCWRRLVCVCISKCLKRLGKKVLIHILKKMR
jgi:hypothetical protein